MMKKHTKKFGLTLFIVSILLVTLLAGCGTGKDNEAEQVEPKYDVTSSENPIVTITMESDRVIKVELYPEVAPNTVNNFISLIKAGFYDGVIFHRVIPGFMIQGGDPTGTGMGGPGYSIAGEFSVNGFTNNLKHTPGVISMARSQSLDSAGSQFFIMVGTAANLDGNYAGFGKVVQGLEVAFDIADVDRNKQDKPLEVQRIKKMTVDTKGKDYPEPEKIGR